MIFSMERLMGTLPSLMLFATQLLVPVADKVPDFEIQASCRAVAAIAMADSQSYSSCISDEDTARGQLIQVWQSFPVTEQARCTAEASGDGMASYVELLVCLQMARDADSAGKITLKGAKRR
jgi:hypothetical protein